MQNPSSAIDTHNEKPVFVPERELAALARQRDELAAENARLRRASEVTRAAEDPSARTEGTSRRLTVLRDALTRKEQEILWLKDHQLARERQLMEARETIAALRAEKTRLESAARAGGHHAGAYEQKIQALEEALRATHVEVQRRMQSSGTDALRAERDQLVQHVEELTRVNTELTAAWHSHEAERARLMEGWTREVAALRADAERVRAEWQLHLEEHRAASTATIERMQADHADELAALRDEYTTARDAQAQERDALAASHAEALAALREESAHELSALRNRHTCQVTALRDEQSRELAQSRTALDAARAELAVLTDRVAQSEAQRLDVEAVRVEEKLAHEQALTTALERADEAHAAALSSVHEAYTRQQEALRTELRAECDGRVAEVQREFDGLKAGAAESEAARSAAELALGEYATDMAIKLSRLEQANQDLAGYRDRFARKLARAMEDIKALKQQAARDARGYADESARLAGLVGRLTMRLVLEGATAGAATRGLDNPTSNDVDEAISLVAEELPESVADALWASREALLARTRGELAA